MSKEGKFTCRMLKYPCFDAHRIAPICIALSVFNCDVRQKFGILDCDMQQTSRFDMSFKKWGSSLNCQSVVNLHRNASHCLTSNVQDNENENIGK
jgi:hypothetical protein